MKPTADSAGLCQFVELEQEGAELGEPLRAELLCPGRLDLGDCLADDADRGGAASGQRDTLGAQVVGIWLALEVAEQVVEGLLGHPEPRGQLGRPRALGSGYWNTFRCAKSRSAKPWSWS